MKDKENTRIGDFIAIGDFNVPGVKIDGVKFGALHVTGARLVIVDQDEKRKIAMFDHVIFDSAISSSGDDAESAETFTDTALGKYLNGPFMKAILEQTKIKPKAVSLITEYEMFGTGNKESNFDETPKRFNFFKHGINRIRFNSDEDYSRWYWLGSKIKGCTTYFYFCCCDNSGFACDFDAADSLAVPPALMI